MNHILAADIALYCQNLVTLRAEFCPLFATDALLIALTIKPSSKLERLYIGNGKVTNIGASELASNSEHKYKEIDIRRNRDVTADGYNIINTICTEAVDGVSTDIFIAQDCGRYFMDKRSIADSM